MHKINHASNVQDVEKMKISLKVEQKSKKNEWPLKINRPRQQLP